MKRECRTCTFFLSFVGLGLALPGEEKEGQCHKNTPEIIDGRGQWPRIKDWNFCGEWKPRTQEYRPSAWEEEFIKNQPNGEWPP